MRAQERLVAGALLVAIAAITLAPLLVMVFTSVKPDSALRAEKLMSIPIAPTVTPWVQAWRGTCGGAGCGGLSYWFVNSLEIVTIALPCSIGTGLVTGYGMTQCPTWISTVLFCLLLLGLFLPVQMVLFPMIMLVREMRLYGSLAGLALVHVVWGLPITALLFRGFFLSVPGEVLRAARIDGAGFWATLRFVLLPLAIPTITTAAALQFIYIWNDFLLGETFGGSSHLPVTVALMTLAGGDYKLAQYNVEMAAALMVALPPVVVCVISGSAIARGLMPWHAAHE